MSTTDTTTTDTATVESQPDVADLDTTAADGTADESEGDEAQEPDADADAVQDGDADEDDDAADGSGREAAKYRRRLREAEAQRDELAARVESLQRAEVERLATAGRLQPAALWASGVELADLLTDDGTVNASKVSAAIEASREQLGIPAPPVGPRVLKEGRSSGRPPKPSGKAAMVSVVMGRDDADG
ncbi:hypothetical protein ACX9NE_25330 [Mycobacterium sp. ML4]